MVRPKNPEPTTTRSGLDKVRTPDRSWPVSLARDDPRTGNRATPRRPLHEPDHAPLRGTLRPHRPGRGPDVRQSRGEGRPERPAGAAGAGRGRPGDAGAV